MAKLKIKKGDLVQVITGRTSDAEKAAQRGLEPGDKGKQGRVLEVYPDTHKILVEGVNRKTRHNKVGQAGRGAKTGGIEHIEAPIDVSNVMLVDAESKQPTRVGYRIESEERDGRTREVRVRVAKRSGKDI